jgi:predicted ester cyclase
MKLEERERALIRIVEDYLGARRNTQHERLFSLLHDDVKILGASGKRYGKKEIKKYFEGSETPFGEIDNKRVGTFVVGNTVIIESLMNAVHVGEYNGIAPSGERFELPGVELFELKDEKIVSIRQYHNDKILRIDDFILTSP